MIPGLQGELLNHYTTDASTKTLSGKSVKAWYDLLWPLKHFVYRSKVWFPDFVKPGWAGVREGSDSWLRRDIGQSGVSKALARVGLVQHRKMHFVANLYRGKERKQERG